MGKREQFPSKLWENYLPFRSQGYKKETQLFIFHFGSRDFPKLPIFTPV